NNKDRKHHLALKAYKGWADSKDGRSPQPVASFEYDLDKTPDDLRMLETRIREQQTLEERIEEYASLLKSGMDAELPRPSFREIVERDELSRTFESFLKRTFCDETLRFWREVDEYLGFDDYSSEAAQNKARHILDTYIRDEAPLVVNIPSW